ncbi:MAG: hypothetical protein IKR25_01795 [Muribaculaceae bacterium]|nr:hypothetical protein [Muribaculaceae bacterium]
MGFWKTITGIQAWEDRKEAKRLKAEAESLYNRTQAENESRRETANDKLNEFARIRLEALQTTVKVFLGYLTTMKLNYKTKEFDLGGEIGLSNNEIKALETVEMNASQVLSTALTGGSLASVAVAGVPSLVTGAVSTFASASTGTAIASLHGAAATNATLAWLGGGSLASGGGGVALGSTVLTGITAASTGIVALVGIGIVAGMIYSKKLTQAEEYYAAVKEFREKAETGWALMDGIIARADELRDVTLCLQERIEEQLEFLYPLIYDYDAQDPYALEAFQSAALMTKAMSELSQVAILNERGYVSDESQLQITKVNKILNRDL